MGLRAVGVVVVVAGIGISIALSRRSNACLIRFECTPKYVDMGVYKFVYVLSHSLC